LKDHPEVVIGTDDMYEHIVWKAGSFRNILNLCPDLYDRTVVLNGVSKAYSMTGWRIGYAAGPEKLIEAMTNIQSQSTSNPTSISQVAAETALNGDQSFIGEMVKAFKERHDYVVRELNGIPGISCLETDGTFYVLPNVQGVIDRIPGISDDVALSEHLIEHGGVAVVPGSAFGAPGHVRLSIATSMANLRKAMERLKSSLT
jgi:aspartate aminotransferase